MTICTSLRALVSGLARARGALRHALPRRLRGSTTALFSLLTLALPPTVAGATPAADTACPPAAAPLTPERIGAGMRDAHDHGFLWRISKDGRSSYLYGTIHAARAEWMFPGPQVVEAMRDSDAVALELDVLDPDIQRRLAASVASARPAKLPPALAARLEHRRAVECVDGAAFAAFAPEFQVASLSVLAARRDGYDPSYAIDIVIAGIGRDLGKIMVSLETPESQMAALVMPTPQETVDFVRSGLDEIESGRARPMLNRMATAWVAGDFADLSRYASWCNCLRTPVDRAAMKRLLDDRNPTLAAAIDEIHGRGQTVFAAVGSLHMVGPTGLPELMRKRGYKVEQGEFAK